MTGNDQWKGFLVAFYLKNQLIFEGVDFAPLANGNPKPEPDFQKSSNFSKFKLQTPRGKEKVSQTELRGLAVVNGPNEF